MEETVVKFWLFVLFWSCPYLVIMKRHTSTFVGFARGYKTTGNRWRGLCPSGTVKRNAHLRICQWTLTYFWSKHPSCRVCAVARIDSLCYFDVVLEQSLYYMILPEECCRFLCDMDYVWTYYIPLYDVDILIVYMYTVSIMKLTFDMTWYLDTFITSYPSLSHMLPEACSCPRIWRMFEASASRNTEHTSRIALPESIGSKNLRQDV